MVVMTRGRLERFQRRAHNPNDAGSNPARATILVIIRAGAACRVVGY